MLNNLLKHDTKVMLNKNKLYFSIKRNFLVVLKDRKTERPI